VRHGTPRNSSVVGAYVAATIVTLVQYLRVKDRRLLLLLALFACQAQALAREWYDVWKDVFQIAACAAGLGLLLVLTLRHPARPQPPAAPPRPGAPPVADHDATSPPPRAVD
jgi:hypothetical protein